MPWIQHLAFKRSARMKWKWNVYDINFHNITILLLFPFHSLALDPKSTQIFHPLSFDFPLATEMLFECNKHFPTSCSLFRFILVKHLAFSYIERFESTFPVL